jgi:predicted nuclease with TOPRIM domain
MDAEKIFLVVFFTLVMPAAWMFLTPLAKRMRRDAERPSEVPRELLEELERLHARVAELEERVDFTERLLVVKREQDQVGGAHS